MAGLGAAEEEASVGLAGAEEVGPGLLVEVEEAETAARLPGAEGVGAA